MSWGAFLRLTLVQRYYQNEALNERIENSNKDPEDPKRPKDWRK